MNREDYYAELYAYEAECDRYDDEYGDPDYGDPAFASREDAERMFYTI